MAANAAEIAKVAEQYYDSEDADNFYALIWGGEDIHIGLYENPPGDIREASRRTVQYMAGLVGPFAAGTRVLDIGAGYGGAARYLASKHGVSVTCLNLSEIENDRNRKLTTEQNLDELVSVVHGSFEAIPEPDASFDVVWSQDAILHSGNREGVLAEVARVLKPGGDFIFTDPMQADRIANPEALKPIYDRIHLSSLASVAFYRSELKKLGFEEIQVNEMLAQLQNHYTRVREELNTRRAELADRVSSEYIERMSAGLGHWIEGAKAGLLNWGVLHFGKTG